MRLTQLVGVLKEALALARENVVLEVILGIVGRTWRSKHGDLLVLHYLYY